MPDTLPASVVQALGGVRRLDTQQIGRWREPHHRARVDSQRAQHPQMESVLRWMGYPPTTGPSTADPTERSRGPE
jgi:hypothetical protein